jgi:hypothetical protein
MGVSLRVRRMSPRPRGFFACLLVAVFALPGVAQAHGGGTYVAGAATAAPTVDGVVEFSEWADATPYSVDFGSLGNATVRFVHTPTDLYVGVIVDDPSPGLGPTFGVFFDNDHDGLKDLGDDVWRATVDAAGRDAFYDPEGADGPGHYEDGDGDGTNDTFAVGSGTEGGGAYELRHPLCSEDTSHDLCVSTGQTLGVDFQYV